MVNDPKKYLVSACLMGLCTRYDGGCKPDNTCIKFLSNHHWVPLCPEQLGGLATPRTPATLVGGDGHAVLAGQAVVVDANGCNVTTEFIRGARQVLNLAHSQDITMALLKSRSPSCGLNPIGVTAALLLENKITCREFG